jgi:hypothetical protein
LSLFIDLSQSLDVEQNALLKSTLDRIRIEDDNVKLKNRITMLETEQSRMLKKINETRRKAD